MNLKKISVLILLILSLYACDKSKNDALADKTVKALVKEPSDYELKIKKLNLLEDNIKDFSSNALIAYQEYISTFGNDVENYKPTEVSNFIEVDPVAVKKLKTMDDALAIPVLDELNQLITSYKINARAFSVAMNTCERYYNNKGYKKDDFENGKGMHKPVIDIFAKFSATNSLLVLKTNKLLKTLELESLDKLKNDGFEVEYLSILGKKEADKLHIMLTSKDYENLDEKELADLFDKTNDIYNKLKTIIDNDTDKFTSKNIDYFNEFEQFLNAFEELYLHKKEKKKFTKRQLKKLKENKTAAISVAGSSNKVIAKYEDILKAYDKGLAINARGK